MRRGAVARGLVAAARRAIARPRTTLALAGAVVALALGLAVARLELRTSNLDLVDPDLPTVVRFRELARDFGTPNALVVVLEGDDPLRLQAAVDRLTPRLAAGPGVRGVIGHLPGDRGLQAIMGVDPFLHSRDRGLYFLLVQPDDPDSRAETIAPFVEGVRTRLAAAKLDAHGIRAGLTGLPQYALDDRDTVSGDVARLSLVSLALVAALFLGAFSSRRRPLLAMMALLVGVAATLGAAALWPGHLTLVSAFFGSILFGLGVDFGIHLVDRLEELEGEGLSGAQAVEAAVAGLAPGLATAATTTAAAFLSLLAAGFRGFAELGFVAGVGVLLCLLATVTVLPALLVLAPPRVPARSRPGRWGVRLARLARPRWALLLAAAALAGPLLGGPRFDEDYLALQPKGSEAVRLEREMVARSALSPQFAAFVVDGRAAADALAARLKGEPTVGEVHSVGDLDVLALAGGREDEAQGLAERFVSRDGERFAVYAYPRGDVWDPVERDRFVAAMEGVGVPVTGMPFLGRVMIERSHRALRVGGALSAALVLLLVFLDLRSVRATVVATLPAALGLGAMLGLMRALGLSFNPLDVMALPVVLGIAVDDGIHLVHRLLQERGDAARALAGTGRGVALTSLTSLAAFGVLGFARHQGLASFGRVLSLGVGASLILSLVVVPACAGWLVGRHRDREPGEVAA